MSKCHVGTKEARPTIHGGHRQSSEQLVREDGGIDVGHGANFGLLALL